ncbi:MAG TPA: AAA family ATPase, partial [Desulfobacterales bacterium]|nr:AAA family ATPase [Desulfobacterales bacterium]
MYTSYFGFKENPFSLTPDPDYLYFSRHHKEAFDHLVYGINERKGFIVITGGIGTGKTTLCRALLGTLDSSTKTALIFNAYISDTELLKTVNKEFGIGEGEPGQSKKDDIDSLNHFLLETFSRGGNAVLLIDEAQNLSHAVLEQIRMLSNLETEKEKLVQIVLAGQSELRELLTSPSLRQLDERIMVRYDLKPLDRRDVQAYVEHRLVVAGGKGNVRFKKGALEAIYAYSRGNPRRINGVCDRALLIAYSKDEFTISKKTAQRAIEDVRGHVARESRLGAGWAQKRVAPVSVLLLVFLITVAGLGGWSFRKEISALISGKATVTSVPPRHSASQADGGPSLVYQVETAEGNRTESLPSAPAEAEIKAASLFLDEGASLVGLFRLFNERQRLNSHDPEDVHLGLYSFLAAPEHYIMFRRPFRVRLSGPAQDSGLGHSMALPLSQYLLIREVTADGASAIDAAGKERRITRDFILADQGLEFSWV